MAKKWKSLGGNPTKLRNTIEDGKDKKAILGSFDETGAYIGEPVAASTLLAAAAPIIAAMLAFIDDKDGKLREVLSATKGALQQIYPDIDLDAYGFLDKKTGKPVQWVVDPEDDENFGGGNNEMPVSKQKPDLLKSLAFPAAAAAAVYFFIPGAKKNLL